MICAQYKADNMCHRQIPFVAIMFATLLSVAEEGSAGVWALEEPASFAKRAPIIVTGKIVKIDVAKAQVRERDQLRFLDCAHIRVDNVHKNALSDFEISEKTTIAAFMHSVNTTVPGSMKNDGSRIDYSTSADLRYEVGTKAIWQLFLKKDGRFYINCHPQQRQPLDKKDSLRKAGVFRKPLRRTTKADWISQDKSEQQSEDLPVLRKFQE